MDQSCWLRVLILLSMYLMVKSDKEYEEEILEYVISSRRLHQLLQEAYTEEKTLTLAGYIVNSKSFREILYRNFGGKIDVLQFYNDEIAYDKFRGYMYTYCRGQQLLRNDLDLTRTVRSFIKFWPTRNMSQSTYDLKVQELGVDPSSIGYLYKFLFYLRNIRNSGEYSFISDEFIRRVADNKDLIVILISRMEVEKQLIFDFNAERRFYEELFDAVDRGVFDKEIDRLEEWREKITRINFGLIKLYTETMEHQQRQFKFYSTEIAIL
ncbi:uncharacterized protein LOC111064509 isoform X1 [Nilaparvata lugens]|uniref:uncharacterized protein LOC111064509 isoform X1 n=1 Tax=Nilaparvata lugens TaxID=108931 RepID=UPI00193E828E|nr:uncharacterized protein LOC111064509 isoform X1 [Nilaparvata lugens]